MLSWVEHEKCFITWGPEIIVPFSHMMMHSPYSLPLIKKETTKFAFFCRCDLPSMVKLLGTGNPKMSTFANSEDQYERPQNVAFHQGLHCFLREK